MITANEGEIGRGGAEVHSNATQSPHLHHCSVASNASFPVCLVGVHCSAIFLALADRIALMCSVLKAQTPNYFERTQGAHADTHARALP